MLIINNIDFGNGNIRHGTEVDAQNLKSLFTRLGYKVFEKTNLSANVSLYFIHLFEFFIFLANEDVYTKIL
jgi:hypothetical protein